MFFDCCGIMVIICGVVILYQINASAFKFKGFDDKEKKE